MIFFRRSLTGLFMLALVAAFLAVGASGVFRALQARNAGNDGRDPAKERVFSANMVRLRSETITPTLMSFGELEARRRLDLRAPTAGSVIELAPEFQDGGRVRAGQLLLKIDPRVAQTAVAVAQTDLAEATADLAEAKSALELARDDQVSVQEQLDLRKRALARQVDLKDRGVGSDAVVETAELAEASAKQMLLSRRQAVQQAQARVNQGQLLIERYQIALKDAQRVLADTEIRAPFAGRLSEVSVAQGSLVATNEPLAQLVDPEQLDVSFRVSTAQYMRLLDDQGVLHPLRVEIQLDTLGTDLRVAARLTRESAQVAEGTTGRLLFAELEDARGLRPGDFVTVLLAEPELEGVSLIPATALTADSSVLELDAQNRLERLEVKLLRRQGDDVIVRAPANALGHDIVAERSPLLGAGIKVNPLRDEDQPSSPQNSPANETADDRAEAEDLLRLEDARRARLIAFVKANDRLPAKVKEKMLDALNQPEVPAKMVRRLEARLER